LGDIKTNEKYKDRLFCWIFGKIENRKHLLDLYNAINDTNYDDINLIEINTLEDVIYMKMKNDVSCIIGNDLSLFEHQSTYNPNMPFREFEYCAKLYDGIVAKRGYDMYGSKLIRFPAPHCYVFYNGTSEHADKEILRLSDAFETPSEGYEWTTTMLNINYGHNKKLMDKCTALYEYSLFVRIIRKNLETMNKSIAVDEAVEYIIKLGGELSDFFRKNRSEVYDMCITEYNEAKHLENIKQEGIEQGIEQERFNTIRKMLLAGKSPKEISDFCDYELEYVKTIKKTIDI